MVADASIADRSVRELLPELRAALSNTFGELIEEPDPAQVVAFREQLQTYLTQVPHDDLLAWFELVAAPIEIAPRILALPIQEQIARWEEYLGYRPESRVLDDPAGLLVGDSTGAQDLCPVAVTNGISEIWVVSPTRSDGELPKICSVSYYETAFFYTPLDGDNVVVTRNLPETGAKSRADAPTLRRWLRAVIDAHRDNRFMPSEQNRRELTLTDRSGFVPGTNRHEEANVVYSYPWPVFAPSD